jgi:hypothetical protein
VNSSILLDYLTMRAARRSGAIVTAVILAAAALGFLLGAVML